MCCGCLPVITDGMSEIEKVRRQAAAYAQTFGVDAVVVKQDGNFVFYPSGSVPDGSQEIETFTRFYVK